MENTFQKSQTEKRIKCEVRLSNEPYFMTANLNFNDFVILETTNEFLTGTYRMNYMTIRINDEIKEFIDSKVIEARNDNSFNNLVECGWFDNELVIEIIELFEDEDYDDVSDEIKEYIVKVIK